MLYSVYFIFSFYYLCVNTLSYFFNLFEWNKKNFSLFPPVDNIFIKERKISPAEMDSLKKLLEEEAWLWGRFSIS